jgi:hypothetical protein
VRIEYSTLSPRDTQADGRQWDLIRETRRDKWSEACPRRLSLLANDSYTVNLTFLTLGISADIISAIFFLLDRPGRKCRPESSRARPIFCLDSRTHYLMAGSPGTTF